MTDYERIKGSCLSRGQLWEDPDFPACQSSVFYHQTPPFQFLWKRASEIYEHPVFISDSNEAFDVIPGKLGDKWLVSCLGVLYQCKGLFYRVVPADQKMDVNYAGVFRFRLWWCGQWVEVLVDDRLPTVNGKLAFVQTNTSEEMWPALLEKAYAKLHGSYEALKYGSLVDGLADLTGGLTEMLPIAELADAAALRSLLEITSIVTAHYFPPDNHSKRGALEMQMNYTVCEVREFFIFVQNQHIVDDRNSLICKETPCVLVCLLLTTTSIFARILRFNYCKMKRADELLHMYYKGTDCRKIDDAGSSKTQPLAPEIVADSSKIRVQQDKTTSTTICNLSSFTTETQNSKNYKLTNKLPRNSEGKINESTMAKLWEIEFYYGDFPEPKHGLLIDSDIEQEKDESSILCKEIMPKFIEKCVHEDASVKEKKQAKHTINEGYTRDTKNQQDHFENQNTKSEDCYKTRQICEEFMANGIYKSFHENSDDSVLDLSMKFNYCKMKRADELLHMYYKGTDCRKIDDAGSSKTQPLAPEIVADTSKIPVQQDETTSTTICNLSSFTTETQNSKNYKLTNKLPRNSEGKINESTMAKLWEIEFYYGDFPEPKHGLLIDSDIEQEKDESSILCKEIMPKFIEKCVHEDASVKEKKQAKHTINEGYTRDTKNQQDHFENQNTKSEDCYKTRQICEEFMANGIYKSFHENSDDSVLDLSMK